jgi:hypothetical protein
MSEVLGARAGSGIVIDVRPNRTVVPSSALTRPAHIQQEQAVRVGKMSSQNASPEQLTGRNQACGTLKWQRGQEAHRAHATAWSTSREPTSAMAVNESSLGSSADDESEEGIDRSFQRAGIPLHLGE